MTAQVLAAALGVAFILGGCGRAKEAAPTALKSSDWKSFTEEAGLQKSALSPYVRGKLVVINRADHHFSSDIQELLPPALVAQTLAEVQTVVWIDWTPEQIPGLDFELSDKGKTYRVHGISWIADVTVIDWGRKLLLGGRRIAGPAPKKPGLGAKIDVNVLNGAQGVPGERPNKDVAAYLEETARSIAVPP
jgi:hypothetical protein